MLWPQMSLFHPAQASLCPVPWDLLCQLPATLLLGTVLWLQIQAVWAPDSILIGVEGK